jgi:hypothetical protein
MHVRSKEDTTSERTEAALRVSAPSAVPAHAQRVAEIFREKMYHVLLVMYLFAAARDKQLRVQIVK